MNKSDMPPVCDPANLLRQATLAILAGGEGARMGKPKGQLFIKDQPILAHLLQQMSWPGPRLLITAPGRENPPASELFDHEFVDGVAGEGPVRGILTALMSAQTQIVLIATVDMPAIAYSHLHWLAQTMFEHPEAQAILLYRNNPDEIEPFPCAMRRSSIAQVSAALANRRRSVRGLASTQGFLLVKAPAEWTPLTWSNLNSPEDLAAYCATETSFLNRPDFLQHMAESPNYPPAGQWAFQAQRRWREGAGL